MLINRLQQIYEVGSHLFINKGYAKTQIKDIAQGIGLSVGTMYHYFVSKADILSFILKATIDPSFIDGNFDYPINANQFDNLEHELKATFEMRSTMFSEPYEKKDAAYTFERMLSDAFDTVAQYGKGFLLIENNPEDVGAIASWYSEYRRVFFEQMLKYVRQYQSAGVFRSVEHPQYAVRLMIETIAWWGMHIMNDAYVPDKDIPIETAKSICLDALVHAYGLH